MMWSSPRFFVPLVIVLVLNVVISFANESTTGDNKSLEFRFANFKRQPSEHQENYVVPAKNIAEVTNDLLLTMRGASGNNRKFISGKRALARVRRSTTSDLTLARDDDADNVNGVVRRSPMLASVGDMRRAGRNVHSHINGVVQRARAAVAKQHDTQPSGLEGYAGCMDPLDANYNTAASIHNATMCDVNCDEVVADLRAQSALTLRVLPSLEGGSIAERSSATRFAIAIEVSWKYLEATMAFLTEFGSQASVESFDIGRRSNGFLGVVGDSPTMLNDDDEIESVWTREYTRQCFDTFVANVPWSDMVDLLWSTGAAGTDEVEGKIRVRTVEPIVFDTDFGGGAHRDLPAMNRTWQGVLPFAMAFPDEVGVVGGMPDPQAP